MQLHTPTTKEKVDEPSISPKKSFEQFPSTDTDSQSIDIKKELDSFSEASEIKNVGSLFDPPVLIKEEIVSEDEL